MKISGKYQPFIPVPTFNRTWPDKVITKAPIRCSVDLRDGNQALINPMGVEQKLAFFHLLVDIGFKEIEVGFPASSQTEYTFIRRLIEENQIPDDVTIQVLCQARPPLIQKTFESIQWAKKVIFNLYNSLSPAQRKYTFNKTKEEIKNIALDGVKEIKRCYEQSPFLDLRLSYSAESFSLTEIDYSLEVCNAVIDTWGLWNDDAHKPILNLPATVECSLPNQFADQIEYFCQHIAHRQELLISLHNHNDRWESIAQCELGLLAGADRVEGCLFGNGERTGNLDLVTTALNMFTQGIDPQLDFSHLPEIADLYTKLTNMPIHPRTPYAWELVLTAFSGSHQDAIRKWMAARIKLDPDAYWDVPYLPFDPHDLGRQYEGIIRINSQSGKGWAVYLLEEHLKLSIPKAMHSSIGTLMKKETDKLQRELSTEEVLLLFKNHRLHTKSPLRIVKIAEQYLEGSHKKSVENFSTIIWKGKTYMIHGIGKWALEAFVDALSHTPLPKFNVVSFFSHSIGEGVNSKAVAYLNIIKEDGTDVRGIWESQNIGRAAISAVVSALNFKG